MRQRSTRCRRKSSRWRLPPQPSFKWRNLTVWHSTTKIATVEEIAEITLDNDRVPTFSGQRRFGEGGSRLLVGSVVFKRSKNIKNWVVVEGSNINHWRLDAASLFWSVFVSLQTKSCHMAFQRCQSPIETWDIGRQRVKQVRGGDGEGLKKRLGFPLKLQWTFLPPDFFLGMKLLWNHESFPSHEILQVFPMAKITAVIHQQIQLQTLTKTHSIFYRASISKINETRVMVKLLVLETVKRCLKTHRKQMFKNYCYFQGRAVPSNFGVKRQRERSLRSWGVSKIPQHHKGWIWVFP